MIVEMMCPNCRSMMQFDDSRAFGYCPHCGCRVTRGFENVQNQVNQPNVFISYNSSNPAVGMVTRIVSSGVKNTYVNGQTLSFHLAPGPQTIVLKIGRKNYGRSIVVPSDNTPVRIYASYNGRAHIDIDQPSVYSPQAVNINPAKTSNPVTTKTRSKASVYVPLAIAATIMMMFVGTLYKKEGQTSALSASVGEFGKTKLCHTVDVTGMALSDAMFTLEDAGFTNLRGEPYDDIKDKDDWIVTAQSAAPGSTIKSSDLIQLDCTEFDDYVDTVYTGKNIIYIQKLADKSGFDIKYQDSSANELDLSSLNDDVKKNVIASSACQYNETSKTAVVTVAYTGEDQDVVLPIISGDANAIEPTVTVPTETPTPTPIPTTTSTPSPTPIPKNKVTKITLNTDDVIEFHKGEGVYSGTATVTKKYPYRYIDTNVVFVSENPKVATIKSLSQKVDSEMQFDISPVDVGETYVYAKTSDGYISSSRIKVVVKPPIMAESIELNEDEVELYVGDYHYLKAENLPENTANKRATWTSSDTSVVTVTSTGTLKAISCGEAVITAKTVNGLTASCYVTVVMEAPEEEDYYYYDSGSYYDDYYEEDYDTEYVWLSATGSKYHSKPNCGSMNPDKAYQVTLEYAQEHGIEPCKKCH
ncbi:MAG: Ig-like domain-containing protein [Clostridiales bacterium]|nr:Ig-like domain-containing protein [Clostridiales bacterium]